MAAFCRGDNRRKGEASRISFLSLLMQAANEKMESPCFDSAID
jgi:hypothetical protein